MSLDSLSEVIESAALVEIDCIRQLFPEGLPTFNHAVGDDDELVNVLPGVKLAAILRREERIDPKLLWEAERGSNCM
jgi:hypothetical protein